LLCILLLRIYLIGKGCKNRNICIMWAKQGLVIALASYQINSKLVWDCCHSLTKLVKHNRVLLLHVLGHKNIWIEWNLWLVGKIISSLLSWFSEDVTIETM
jgi:hypothetical protein